jgi:hypothetical protein
MNFENNVKCLSNFWQAFKFRVCFSNKIKFISIVFHSFGQKKVYQGSCLIISLFVILLFSACGQKKSEKNPIYLLNSFNKKSSSYVLLNEAKYSDIPIPVGFKSVNVSKIEEFHLLEKSEFLSYQGDLNLDDTVDFYNRALEREGWIISDFSGQAEGLLVCSKPAKQCVVSLRKFKKNKTNVYMFIKNKKDEKVILNDINSKDISFLKDNLEMETNFGDFVKG